MKISHASLVRLCALLVVTSAATARAQACLGLPARGSVAFEHSSLSFGNSNGVAAAFAGGRTAITAGFRSIDRAEDVTSMGADLGFHLQFPAGKVRICPGVGFGFTRDKWEPEDAAFVQTANNLAARLGVSAGLDLAARKELRLIPFVGARYEFQLTYINLESDEAEVAEESGDTTSTIDIQYGLTARYRFAFLGWSAQRNNDNSGMRPYLARYVVGFTWGRR